MNPIVTKALEYAAKAHGNQKRSSGEAYIEHPKAVVGIIKKDIIGDQDTIIATLLHDTIEDTPITREDIIREFDETVYKLVEGVTKVGAYEANIELSKEERSQESVRKMLRMMGQDLRVVFIKLADRLHNMRTLAGLPAAKKQRIALETHELYEPLAHLVGIAPWYEELADLSASVLQKDEYESFIYEREQLEQRYLPALQDWHTKLSSIIKKNVPTIQAITLRTRPVSEVLAKNRIVNEQRTIENFYEVQLIVESTSECYKALGAIHAIYTHVPSKLKDFIGSPRLNGYQALHTNILTNVQHSIRVRIFSREMYNAQKYGLALPFLQSKKHDWSKLPERLQRILSLDSSNKNSRDFFAALEQEILGQHMSIHVVGKKTTLLTLAVPATVLDAAFTTSIDTGLRVESATINRVPTSLKAEIHNGDILEFTLATVSVRSPIDRLSLKTYAGREQLHKGLRTLPDNIQVSLAQELISIGVDIALDPFFFSGRKQILLHDLWNSADEADLKALGTGAMSVFVYINKYKQPRDFLLLNPALFTTPTRRTMNTMRYVLQTDVDTLRSGKIIGVQQRPDVISVYAVADEALEYSQKNSELIPLEIANHDLVDQPFEFGLECHFAENTATNFVFSHIHSEVHGMTIVSADAKRAILRFKAIDLENIRYVFRHLMSSADITHIHRTSI